MIGPIIGYGIIGLLVFGICTSLVYISSDAGEEFGVALGWLYSAMAILLVLAGIGATFGLFALAIILIKSGS